MNTPNTTNNQDKAYFRVVLALSILVFIAVVALNRKLIPRPDITPEFVYNLPGLNAIINATCSILLLVSLYFIKQKNISAHKITNMITFALSSVFLVSYVLFHYFVDSTEFPKENPLRNVYLAVLVPHIILAALVLPLILLAFYHGLKMNVAKHKKLVRFAYPIWLFVTVSGVVVYLMISPYYNF